MMRAPQERTEPLSTPDLPQPENSTVAAVGSPATHAPMLKLESEGAPYRLPAAADNTAIPDTGVRSAETVESLVASNQPLLARQDQQLRVGRQNLTDCILIPSPCFHTFAHLLNQMLWDVLYVLFAIDHKRQGPQGVPFAFSTVAVRSVAA